MISVRELFSVGIGPSSSHTVGPMRAAERFAAELRARSLLDEVSTIRAELFGSLGLTGRGHGSHIALVVGLEGSTPEHVDPDGIPARMDVVRQHGRLSVLGMREIAFTVPDNIVFHRRARLPHHPNGLRLTAVDTSGAEILVRMYYSIGGGFIAKAEDDGSLTPPPAPTTVPFPFGTGAELLAHTAESGLDVAAVVHANETTRCPPTELRHEVLGLWAEMRACVERGLSTEGVLPGGLRVPRRASGLYARLLTRDDGHDPLAAMEWVNAWAMAVNEENAAGGRVVTAPTNGAAGIIPAVLHYYCRFVPNASDDGILEFFLTATAIGTLFKEMASISGAEVGCQGEVGSACAMAAGGLAAVLGGTPQQVENAAEIALEHNLGLTCDPVGGLVQVPCIERNAVAAVTAINAARIALYGNGQHIVSLDSAIKTMRDTGRDMKDKYKETARGGLAVNVPEC